ncbi:hypothetical protein CASFOL_005122 [Castilleja foliolosa]|uniref:SMP-LTD domain-containing protein n=1 Tax=Castilleja foliolosa TaxID=1961234 RepID=A0ABD3E3L9_9LAMI
MTDNRKEKSLRLLTQDFVKLSCALMTVMCLVERARKAATENSDGGLAAAVEGEADELKFGGYEFIIEWSVTKECYRCHSGGGQCITSSMDQFQCDIAKREKNSRLVDWFNKFIQDTWPYFDKVTFGIIKSSAEATFAEYIGNFRIKSIYFEHLTLGNLAPKIQGVKAQESKENELILDLALRWAGNADIVLGIKLLSLQFTVQIVDFQISASTRVILRPFVPTFPCFSSIAVSLMEKPKIDFGLRVMGGDIMSIPGLYHIVQEIVARQVAKLYLWPQTYEIDILDDSLGATKKPVAVGM